MSTLLIVTASIIAIPAVAGLVMHAMVGGVFADPEAFFAKLDRLEDEANDSIERTLKGEQPVTWYSQADGSAILIIGWRRWLAMTLLKLTFKKPLR